MTTIPGTLHTPPTTHTSNGNNPSSDGKITFWNKARSFAKIVDSRESTYRLALDLSAFDLPTLAAEAFRGIWKFLEACYEAGIGTFMVFAAPYITTFVGKISAKFILPKEEQGNTNNYLLFRMSELESTISMEKAIKERIEVEEPKDQLRVGSLYKEIKKEEKAKYYEDRINNIAQFSNSLKGKCTDEIREKIYRLKRAVIIGESFIEGGVWGSFGLTLRLFRKYVLRQERFTGTMGYLSDAESSGLGEGGELNLFQKVAGTTTILLSPILNTILLKQTKDKQKVENSSFLKIVDSHLDMTHGVFPKLGLLFTYTSLPKWIGTFITSQGWYERIERIFKFLTIIPSWWLGHRITNGVLAKKADKELSSKFNTKAGILLEPEYLKPDKTDGLKLQEKLKYSCPEPARIHHVIETIEERQKEELTKAGNNQDQINEVNNRYADIRKAAEELHAKTLYKGFALHSFLVWCVTMLVNWTTKLRVKHALGE